MKALLVARFTASKEYAADARAHMWKPTEGQPTLVSRSHVRPDELRYGESDVPVDDIEGVDWATVFSKGQIDLLVVQADVQGRRRESEPLELELTEIVIDLVTEKSVGSDVRWVGRSLLMGGAGTIFENWVGLPDGWIGQPRTDGTVEVSTLHLDGGQALLGWGNNVLPPSLPRDEFKQVILGFLDAQYIWSSMDDLAERGRSLVNQYRTGSDGSKLRKGLIEVEELAVQLSAHHLATDDLHRKVQGNRHLVATGLLNVWGYEAALARMESQLQSTTDLVSARLNRRRERYDTVVEAVLAAIAATGLVQLVVALVALAFVGRPDSPRQLDDGSMLGFFESTNVDVVLWISMGLVVAATFAIVMVRRGR